MNIIRLLTLSIFASAPLPAATLFVSTTGSQTSPYSSEQTAAVSVQKAVDAAASGDVIRVAAGRYRGDIDFLGKNITLLGAGPSTIIEGSGPGSVVRFTRGETRQAVLDSLQITGGRAKDGAGILISNASPTIRRTVIFRNVAGGSGAGILVTGARSNPTIRNNLIAYNVDSSPAFTDAHQVFIDSGASARVINNTMVRGNGNAILVQSSRRPSLIANNILAWNGSVLRNGSAIGRGICDFSGSARIRYNLFFQNTRAAILTDVPGAGLEDIALIGDAEPLLRRGRVANNFDASPRLFRFPSSRKAPSRFARKISVHARARRSVPVTRVASFATRMAAATPSATPAVRSAGADVFDVRIYVAARLISNQQHHPMKQLLILALVALALPFTASAKELVNVDSSGVAIKGYDPVAYFTDGKAVKGDAKFQSTSKGAIYYFASADHKAAFDKEPAKYEPQFGGFCAYAVSKNSTAGIKPEAFQIVDGRLLLQYNLDVRETFSKDTAGNLKKADANWPGIVEKKGK